MTAGLFLEIYKYTGRSWNTNMVRVGKHLKAHPVPWAATPGHPGVVEGGKGWELKELEVPFQPKPFPIPWFYTQGITQTPSELAPYKTSLEKNKRFYVKLFEIKMIITCLCLRHFFVWFLFKKCDKSSPFFYYFWAEQLNFQLEKAVLYQVFVFCIQEVSSREQDPVLHNIFPGDPESCSTCNNLINPFQVTWRRAGQGANMITTLKVIKTTRNQILHSAGAGWGVTGSF